ncbi:uroplakin-3b [Phalacrocorax aristotelis]|uniref:uroplakin-3b n=1 Tax=Phalacrocorax aristotelis TaxID=126867 RepID=UPI003F4B3AB2
MELLRVLLALAGMGAATGLGDSPYGDGAEGERGSPCELLLCWYWCSWTPAQRQAGLRRLLSGAEHRVHHSPPVPPALLPYVPRVPPTALPGKVTASTFALERPCCIFDQHANASDTVWLVVAFANASAAFRNPPSRADVPLYKRLPTTHFYMTLEAAAATYACSAPSPAILRVGSDTACGDQGGCDPCNGPLPSPGPYRVKFLVMGCHGPKAETRWSDPILLRRGTGGAAVPARVPHTCPVGVLACGSASALCHHPKTQVGRSGS